MSDSIAGKRESLERVLREHFSAYTLLCDPRTHEWTLECDAEHVLTICKTLQQTPSLGYDMLMDVCGVDYSTYGLSEWETRRATTTGFERGVESEPIREEHAPPPKMHRFAVVYHLLSTPHAWRLRVRAWVHEEHLTIDSVCSIWASANWFEREVFDLFGIFFENHPDLKRILTDYGFVGHPLRKDFPLIGHVAVRYDAASGRVIEEPVDIQPRVLTPRVIRLPVDEVP